ncbi:hypothetical protein BDZ85DRAFT_308633, partial [Elsinoe ampelina]
MAITPVWFWNCLDRTFPASFVKLSMRKRASTPCPTSALLGSFWTLWLGFISARSGILV